MSGRRLRFFTMALLGLSALLAAAPGCSAEEPSSKNAPAGQEVRLTIYDRGTALVEEARRMALPKSGELHWREVPKTLDATSIQLSGPAGLQVLEERFLYDPMTHERLIKASRGEKVFLVETIEETGREKRTEAVVVAADGPPVYRIGEEIHLGHPGRVVLPALPEGLHPEPEIVWRVDGPGGEADLTARYLAGGLNWRADYVLHVEEASLGGSLSGAFTLTNSSGTDFDSARVQLVAGQVRRAAAPPQPVRMMMATEAKMERADEAPVADLHRYTLDGPVSLEDGRTVRVGFLQAEGLKLARRYEVRGGWLGWSAYRPQEDKLPVAVVWLLNNTAEAGLGRPLPAGTVRLYVAEGQKPLILAGEVALRHTPAGVEEVKLETGEAFDFVATRRQRSFKQLSKELSESSWMVKVENKKKTPVAVRVIENVPPQAEVISASHKAERPSADRLEFNVEAPADGKVEVTYTIRVKR